MRMCYCSRYGLQGFARSAPLVASTARIAAPRSTVSSARLPGLRPAGGARDDWSEVSDRCRRWVTHGGTVNLSRIRPVCGRSLLKPRLGINDLEVVEGFENVSEKLKLTVPPEWRRHLVLHYLDTRPVTHHLVSVFNRTDPSDIHADRGIKL